MNTLHLGVALGFVSISMYISVLVLVRLNLAQMQDFTFTNKMSQATLEVPNPHAALYKTYLNHFGKRYTSEEMRRRFEIFKDSLVEVDYMNRESGAKFGLTKFSDMAKEEFMPSRFSSQLNYNSECGDTPVKCRGETNTTINYRRGEKIPPKFDWRDKGYVGPVLDQKQCNGCWAFGIVGVMETQAAILSGKFGPRLSIQELIDCSTENHGCESGNVYKALGWICHYPWGVVTEEEYPLKLVTQECQTSNLKYEGLHLKQYWQLCPASFEEEDIMRLVYHHGPVAIVVNADPWRGYNDGIISHACIRHEGSTSDHVVQIVGYDNSSDTDIPHFIVRNSWGEDFGEEGYVRLAVGKNVCGLKDKVHVVDVAFPGH